MMRVGPRCRHSSAHRTHAESHDRGQCPLMSFVWVGALCQFDLQMAAGAMPALERPVLRRVETEARNYVMPPSSIIRLALFAFRWPPRTTSASAALGASSPRSIRPPRALSVTSEAPSSACASTSDATPT